MGSLQNIGNRGSNAAQQLAAQLSRSGGSSNPGVHAHQQNMLGGSGVGSGSSWGTGTITKILITYICLKVILLSKTLLKLKYYNS